MFYILTKNTTSNVERTKKKELVCFALAGDKVELVAEHGNVFIVKNKKYIFPVNKDILYIFVE